MPLFNFVCSKCDKSTRKIMSASAAARKSIRCPQTTCTGWLRRAPAPPTANVVETLDKPGMVRRLERPKDAERLYRERAQQGPKDE